MASKKTIEERYVKLSPREHVLKRPDTYVGSVIKQEIETWVLVGNKIEKATINYIPAFLKIFDEIITNASDHAHRPKTGVKNIKINIDNDFKITVYNDGTSIPVEIHKEHNIYVPELIFGHLMTGENYDDTEDRTGAGRNGLGAKLTNIFSTRFEIDLHDGKNHYYQRFTSNLKSRHTPEIKKGKAKSYTQISYEPDFEIFDMDDECKLQTLALFKKRVYDLAVYNPKVNVYLNDEKIEINSVNDWVRMHIDNDAEIYEEIDGDWTMVFAESDTGSFEQCSIINGNTTWLGGTHVDNIMNMIVNELTVRLTKGKKVKIRPSDIRNRFHLFVVGTIPNPVFDSQTKERLSMRIGNSITISNKFYNQLMKSSIVESIMEWVEMKEQQRLKKLNSKAAGKTVRIPKLVDAHKAGTKDSEKCFLILSEGDSSKQTALAGIESVGKDYWGVFPLRGKPLNVRDASITKIADNVEIQNIIKILGLVPGKKYVNLSELRYGKVVFMTDADIDGYSIKGLLINIFHKFWPELLELGFCFEFITPIIVATKNKNRKEYYDLQKYNKDKENNKLNGYKIKYYKGLGTINKNEIQEMFKNIDKHLIKFDYSKKRDSDKIDMIFKNKRVEERKNWLLEYKGEVYPNKLGKDNKVSDFIDNEFIQFSNGDNIRSIPHMMDGLKPSTRKILYAGFKKLGTKIKDEMKVAQFGAYTAEVTHYNSGENSLMLAVVGMAQDYIGANNIPLLMPSGQFGTRRDPKASASPRYIFTYLNTLTNYIFRKEDNNILNYLDEDGFPIEPKFYLPIIPMILVNGAEGIGTGWSTDIPKYNPLDLIKIIKKTLEKPNIKYNLHPHYIGWTGQMVFDEDNNRYITTGTIEKVRGGYLITELPINVSTDKYLENLDKLVDKKTIKGYIDDSTDEKIKIQIKCDKLEDPIKDLKMQSYISINNMNMYFDNAIVKYDDVRSLIKAWITERLKYYEIRKEQHIKVLQERFNIYINYLNFVGYIIEGSLVINNRSKKDIEADLKKLEFDMKDGSYNYLLNIPVYNLSKEKFQEYKRLAKDSQTELKEYKRTTPEAIWINELEELEKLLKKS